MPAQQNPQSPEDSIHIVLRATAPISYRDGYIADVMRYMLGTPGGLKPGDPRVGPGIYMYKGEIYEKVSPRGHSSSESATPAAVPTSPSAHSGGERAYPPTAPASCGLATAGLTNLQLALAQSPLVCSTPPGAQPPRPPPPSPPSDFTPDPKFIVRERTLDDEESTTSLSMGGLSKVTAADGHPYFFSYCAEIVIYPDGSLGPVEILGDDGVHKAVVYFLRLDTAGLADSWVFGNIPWDRFSKLTRDHAFTDQQLQIEYSKKNLMPFPRYSPEKADSTELTYGVDNTDLTAVCVKQASCAIALHQWKRLIRVPNFPIGVVYGADDGHIIAGFDGLLALGRGIVSATRMPAGARYGPAVTLPEGLYRQKLLKSRNFWIHITHPTWDESGRDFMCLGDYRDPRNATIPQWIDVECSVKSGLWEITLAHIEVFDSANPEVILMQHNFRRLKVIVDTGCTQSYLPGDFVSMVEGKFSRGYNVPTGRASYQLPKSLVIRFYFGNDDGSNHHIDGQAIRFLVSPDYIQGEHPAIGLKASPRAVLGLNFFRTFIIGFRDHRTRPQLSLAKHPDVPSNRAHISACKDVIHRAAPQPIQPLTQQQEDVRETGRATSGQPTTPDPGHGPSSASGGRSTAVAGAAGHSSSGKSHKLQKAQTLQPSTSGQAHEQRLGSNSTRVHVPEPPASRPIPDQSHARSGSQSHAQPAVKHGAAQPQNPAMNPQHVRDRRAQSDQLAFPSHPHPDGGRSGSTQHPRERLVSYSQSQQNPPAPGGEASAHDSRTHHRSTSKQNAHAPGRAAPLLDPYAPGSHAGAPARYVSADLQPTQPQSYMHTAYQNPQPRERRGSRAATATGYGSVPPPPEQRQRQTSQAHRPAPNPSGVNAQPEPRPRPAGAPLERSVSNTQARAPVPGPRPPAQYQAPGGQHAPVIPPESGQAPSSSQRTRKLSSFMNVFSKR